MPSVGTPIRVLAKASPSLPAAVNRQRSAGDVGSRGAAKKRHKRPDIFHAHKSASRMPRRDVLALRGFDWHALLSCNGRNPIENIATTHLSILAEQLNQVVYLGVRSGLDMICIGRYESTSQIQVGRGHVGMRGPFGMTPSCLAMMAKLPHEEVNAIIHANLSRYHRIEGFDEIGFRKAVDNAIRNGYSTYDGIILDHTTSAIGVAICDPDNYPIAGIATTFITGWLDDSQWHNCLQMLKKAAENIANDLYTKEVQTM